MARFALFNIGCIECGVSSNIVCVSEDKAKLDTMAERLDKDHGWREGGQNHYEVFELAADDVVTDEYREALSDGSA